ncbi:MAG: O-antigen ligase family protein [Candidatus Omnitrophica bacterium]|nr:O-antigen ligase family protein [Candidatus Omnitrophota bacterium]
MNKEKIFSLTETLNEYVLYAFIFFSLMGNAGGEVCFGLLALCFVIRKVLRPDFHFLKKTEHLWLLLFFIFCGLSLINSGPFLQKSLKALFLKWGEYAMVFLFIREAMENPARLKRVAWVILTVAAIIGIDGLIQFFTGHDFFYGRPMIIPGPYYQTITAQFKNSNNLSSYLGFVAPLALSMTAVATTRKSRCLLGMLTIVLAVCLLLTYSRGAWFGFFFGVLFMIVISRRWKVLLPLLLLFVMVILTNASLSGRAIPKASPTTGQTADISSGRFEYWEIGLQLVKENPFLGKGLGTFMDYCGQRVHSMHADYAHNCYLQIWAESGIFSLLAFLLFVGTLFRKGIQTFRRNQDPFLLGLLGGIFALLIHSFFDTQLYSVAQAFLFWSMLGILAAASQNNTPGSKTTA